MRKNYLHIFSITLLMLPLLFSGYSYSQVVSSYGFTSSSGTYTPLVSGTPTSLGATDDDVLSNAAPIGFNFVYNSQTVTTFRASSNGVVSFHATGSSSATNNLATTTASQRLAVAPLWDDLQCTAGVTYELSGSAPNRVLTVEFKNMEWNWNSGTAVISFQVKLYETTNVVEFVYQQEATAVNSGSASIGIMGSGNTDYISLTNVTAAPVISTTASTNTIAAKPATGQIYRFTPPPPTPPTPTQDPTAPTCATGTQLSVTGTPATGVTWYWQTSATGTSTATAVSGPYTVFNNGTYYVRAFDAIGNAWSISSSSIVVSNMPVATSPSGLAAAQNPACLNTTLSLPAPPAGTGYFWQGTTVNGTSSANPSSTPYPVTTSGTYTVAAYDSATSCWSNTASLAVTIQTAVPPNAVVNPTYFNYCTSDATMPISAATPPPSTNLLACTSNATASGLDNSAVTATVNNFSCVTGTPQNASMNASISGSFCGAWYSFNIIVNGTTVASNQCSLSNFNLTPYLPLTSVSIVSNDLDAYGDNVTLNLTVTVNHITQPYNLTWFATSTGGSSIASGTTIETIGTPVMPTATNGSYQFYVANNQGVCEGSARTLVTLNVADVLAVINPIDATCNGQANGSFSLGAINCGTAPLTYSVDGGPFGPIPTNLLAGTYSIVIKDANNLNSAPIVITINEPTAPTNLNAFGLTFFQGMLTWTPQGNETSWVVEYGPSGFTQGTGTIVNATNDTIQLTGLTEDTDYDFYVQAGCVTTSDWAGPHTFSTISQFLAHDNDCGPGFIDISTTGTSIGFTDDDEDVKSITLPWAWNINGQTVTAVQATTNGYISFGTASTYNYNPAGPGMYICAADQQMLDASTAYYQSIGTAPNRKFIIQWNGMQDWPAAAANPSASYEIIVDEATMEVYYIYDNSPTSMAAFNAISGIDMALYTSNGNDIIQTTGTTNIQNYSCWHFYKSYCPNVKNMVTLTYTEDAQLNWDAGLYGETNWTIIYGLEGFDPTVPGQAIDTLTVTSSDANFGGTLTQLTCYDAYVYSECQADNLTSSGFLVHFCTKPYCADITGLAGQSDPDSLELTWNWIQSSPVYPVTGFNIQYGMTGFQLGSGTMATANGVDFSDTIFDANLIASGVYQVYVQAECSNTNDTSNWVGPISVVMTPTNDIVCSQEALQLNTTYTFNTSNATVSLNEVNIAPPATGAQTTDGWVNSTLNGTLWYSFVAPASGQVRINSTAISYNSQSAVYSATNCGDFNTFTLIAANDDAIEGGSTAPNYTVCGLTPGNTYYLMYDKFNATNGNFGVYISEVVVNAGTANAIDSICYGSTVDLSTTISNNEFGGTWSSSIPSVNASITDSIFNSNGLAYTVFTFEYRVVDGCAFDTVNSHVHVFGPSNAGQDGTITACRNEPIDLLAGLNGNSDLNGDWYDPSNILLSSSAITTENFPGQYNYDYISGNGVCPDDTANVVVTVTSCNWLGLEETVFEGVSVYPNPTTGLVKVDAVFENGAFSAEVTDVNGRVIAIKNASITAQNNTINLTGVERGTYFIKLSKDNVEKVFRIVVQ